MRFDIDYDEDNKTKKKKKKKNDIPNISISLIITSFLIIASIIIMVTYLLLQKGNTTPKTAPTPVTTKTPSQLTVVDENSNERPIAVMIDNAIGDAKHAGLQESYLNYEILVEGGLTRIMSIYKDTDVNLIGPIRSSRHYFLDYALESDAIFVHYGWSPYAERDTSELNVDNINGLTTSTPFRRDKNSVAPHNVFTRMSYLESFLATSNYNKNSSNWKLFNYSVVPVNLETINNDSKIAEKINIPYSENEYRTYAYDESNGYYLRSSNGNAQIDRKSNNQLHYKNIIIEKVQNKTIDEEGRQELETVGKGTAYYITNGQYLQINWEKISRLSKTIYTYEDGTEITLNDGNTFIQIVPIECNITID